MTLAPDGVERHMMVYNNQFPGPLIEANWGDWIEVHVTNNLKNNGYKEMTFHGANNLGPQCTGMEFSWNITLHTMVFQD